MSGDTERLESDGSGVEKSLREASSSDSTRAGTRGMAREQFVTTKEAADALHVTQQTVRNWYKSGVLRGYSVSQGSKSCVRITLESVQDVIEGKAW